MTAPYETPAPKKSALPEKSVRPKKSALIEAAYCLSGSRLNPLVLMSDPDRTPDLLSLAAALPRGSALIYRHFGSPGLEGDLRRITAERGVQLLIGNDPELADACAADGVHFSRRASGADIDLWREVRPDWILSAAAMKSGLDERPLHTLDALFVSAVFASNSPSAGTAIGVAALEEFAASSACPVFALGGITDANAGSLIETGIAGIASIGGLADILRTTPMTDTPTPSSTPKSTKTEPGTVTITKEEGGEMIVFNADVAGSSATGELTLRRVADGVWNANHTGVPKEIGGRGVGKALVAAMVEDARQQGYRVVPGCPFVAKLFERKPDWAKGIAA